ILEEEEFINDMTTHPQNLPSIFSEPTRNCLEEEAVEYPENLRYTKPLRKSKIIKVDRAMAVSSHQDRRLATGWGGSSTSSGVVVVLRSLEAEEDVVDIALQKVGCSKIVPKRATTPDMST